MAYPGMYPNLAGKIASHGPYKNVAEISRKIDLTTQEQAVLKKYAQSSFIATEPNPLLDPMRGRDPYRGTFYINPARAMYD